MAASNNRFPLRVACPVCQQGRGRSCIAIGRNAAPGTYIARPHPQRASAAAFDKIAADNAKAQA